ncbi:porin family protein [Mangrovimonas aestuarii]|uniref:porin family protein n=1 Tax=Mangrovimonas aestuarii TaxID=3018443 RepID=UPI002377E183|nr:porin family protein [Mangrovimonas aestuarii]
MRQGILSIKKTFIFTVLFLFIGVEYANSQVLISLIFGDKLNSDKIEFGLDGGLAISDINGIDHAKARQNFNLGFYFDFKLKPERLKLHTGVIVKSPVGAKDISTYSIGDQEIDSLFEDGNVSRKLNYFYIPVAVKYNFVDDFFFEIGPQIGLLYKARDTFESETVNGQDLELENDVRNEYKTFDLGLTAGLGYKLMKGTGINLGIRYYSGFLNIAKNDTMGNQRNQVFYFFAGIPIGAGKKSKQN